MNIYDHIGFFWNMHDVSACIDALFEECAHGSALVKIADPDTPENWALIFRINHCDCDCNCGDENAADMISSFEIFGRYGGIHPAPVHPAFPLPKEN